MPIIPIPAHTKFECNFCDNVTTTQGEGIPAGYAILTNAGGTVFVVCSKCYRKIMMMLSEGTQL